MLIIWKKPNNEYYSRKVRGTYQKYEVGYINQYGHEIVLIIDLQNSKIPFWKRYIECRRDFLRKMERFFEERS